MLRLLPLLFLLGLAGLFTSCETEETYELATSSQDFIELTIDGRDLLLNARPAVSSNYYYYEHGQGNLHIEHSTPDNLHAIYLNLADCGVEAGEAPRSFGTKAGESADCPPTEQEVTIGYTTFEMSGSPSCPHLEGVPTELTGTVTIDNWSEDGRVTGTFETDPTGTETHVLSGRFQTTLQ